MSPKSSKNSDYYPLRWKVADFVENIIILHRTRVALIAAALGVILVIIGVFVLGWRPWGSGAETDQILDEEGIVSEIADQDSTNPDSGPENPDETVEIDPGTVSRPVATDAQLEFTRSGIVIELGSRTMRLSGGSPSDEAADSGVQFATELFPNRELLDAQVLSTEFSETDEIVIRLVEPNLFATDTSSLNPDLSALIADVVYVARTVGYQTVDVVGHANTGELSSLRADAVAEVLVNQGLSPETVTSFGLGNSEPIPNFPEYIDFVIR